MATSAVSGNKSAGLDVATIVADLMEVERRPVNLIESKITRRDVEISALGVLKSKASALESALSALEDPSRVGGKAATSSRPEAVTVEATSSAAASDIEVKVVSTAQAGRLAVSGFASESALVGAGTLTIQRGQYSSAGGVTSFSAGGTSTINVPAGATLSQVRDLVNASGAPLQANIVKTGSTYSLVMTGSSTGETGALRVAVSNTSDLPVGAPGLGDFAYSEVTGEASQAASLQSARNAVVYVDGLRVERESNTIDGVVAGLTFQLRKPTSVADVNSAEITTVSVNSNKAEVRASFDRLVSAYNDLAQTYATLAKSDTDPAKRGSLNGDSIAAAFMSRIRSGLVGEGMSYSTSDGNGGTVTNNLPFWKFGLELQKDGTLKLDEAKFNAALNDGTADKLQLGVSIPVEGFLSDSLVSGGLLDSREASVKNAQQLLEERKAQLEQMLTSKEERYRRQYAALDATLFRLDQMNTALKTALDQLMSNSKD